jgi:hypothetical protein
MRRASEARIRVPLWVQVAFHRKFVQNTKKSPDLFLEWAELADCDMSVCGTRCRVTGTEARQNFTRTTAALVVSWIELEAVSGRVGYRGAVPRIG